MKYSGRMNSFIRQQNRDIFETIDIYRNMDGITHLEFNYPEHVAPFAMADLKKHMGDMKVNGMATRFQEKFLAGEFTNPDEKISRDAVQLCKDAVDACRELGGEFLTVWLGYDGFDYSFQIDYEAKWKKIIASFQEVADYGSDIKISIEYKPFEPRSFSMIDSIGLTLLAIEEIGRPNVGVTLDFCHMLMKHEHPAFSLAMAAKSGKLFGLHLNDGHRLMDNGLIFGSVNFTAALEVVYYMKKYNFEGVVFFDSFPFREDAKQEIYTNIETIKAMSEMIDRVGMERIQQVINKQDGVSAQRLVLELLKK